MSSGKKYSIIAVAKDGSSARLVRGGMMQVVAQRQVEETRSKGERFYLTEELTVDSYVNGNFATWALWSTPAGLWAEFKAAWIDRDQAEGIANDIRDRAADYEANQRKQKEVTTNTVDGKTIRTHSFDGTPKLIRCHVIDLAPSATKSGRAQLV